MKRFERFENQQRIQSEIEELVENKEISYMDAIILYSQDNDLEIEHVASIVGKNSRLRSKVELEAEELHFLKKKSRLPIA